MVKLFLVFVVVNIVHASAFTNVYGEALKDCSSAGMALTGFTREGRCIDNYNDSGSHHVCIDLSSTTGGNFCAVTNQDDWCSSFMSCHEDKSKVCQVKNWCVCEWAFASYVTSAGGCDKIQNIDCDATNSQVITAYRDYKAMGSKYQDALDCIVKRCALTGSS